MSLELVTGYHGEEHVTASQVAAFNRAAVSSSDKVFSTGNAFALTMVDANTARVADGDMLLQGRHITQPANEYTDLTVDSGQSGRWRKDLVVIEYNRVVETGVESATLKVLKGTPASSQAAAVAPTPTIASIETAFMTQFALWMIPINEISVGTPVKQFSTPTTSANGSVNELIYPPNADLNSGKNLFDYIYPVGSIYMSVNSTNPGTLFGGTWVAWGLGRAPMGVSPYNTAFDTPEETGGALTHTHPISVNTGSTALTVNQLPSHSHTVSTRQISSTRTNKFTVNPSGIEALTSIDTSSTSHTTSNTGGGQGHTHTVNGNTNAGSSLPPYITCYMWKRTA